MVWPCAPPCAPLRRQGGQPSRSMWIRHPATTAARPRPASNTHPSRCSQDRAAPAVVLPELHPALVVIANTVRCTAACKPQPYGCRAVQSMGLAWDLYI